MPDPPAPVDVLPHRPPFLFVDELVEVVPGSSASGRWHLTGDEAFFAGHFPGRPTLPGVLMVEALAQVGAVAVLLEPRYAGKLPLFGGIDGVRFRRQVVPGDTVDLRVEMGRLSARGEGPRGRVGRGRDGVRGRPALRDRRRVNPIPHPTVEERRTQGKAARKQAPVASHAGWVPARDRPDPVALLEQQNATREPDLVPVRHGRMMVSPFTFYRGAAKVMAADLQGTPTAGLHVQLCGDAHLSNFGAFASPERVLLFDLNDFDETLPGPFEYDVKRLAASVTIAARNNGLSPADQQGASLASATAYRQAMARFAEMRRMEVWYSRVSVQDLLEALAASSTGLTGADRKRADAVEKTARKRVAKAHARDSLQALSKLAEHVDGRYRIVSQPPVVVPMRDLPTSHGYSPHELEDLVREQFRAYRATLPDDRRHLLEQFEILDMARKVVGVGSVGTQAYILLLQGRDSNDPLFLQAKEATRSVLEDHLPPSRYRHAGERVVQGQRLMQAASDLFLGWTTGQQADRYLYWRQLRDMKASAEVDAMDATLLTGYAGFCAETLARAHARSGDPVALAAYLGKKDGFDHAITDFAQRYADQNEQDHEAFLDAIRSGRLQAVEGA